MSILGKIAALVSVATGSGAVTPPPDPIESLKGAPARRKRKYMTPQLPMAPASNPLPRREQHEIIGVGLSGAHSGIGSPLDRELSRLARAGRRVVGFRRVSRGFAIKVMAP